MATKVLCVVSSSAGTVLCDINQCPEEERMTTTCVIQISRNDKKGSHYTILYSRNNCVRHIFRVRAPKWGTILCMRSVNEKRRFTVTWSLIGRAYTQNDPNLYVIAIGWMWAAYTYPVHINDWQWPQCQVLPITQHMMTYICKMCAVKRDIRSGHS